nr:hypothetical protein [Armatimonas sp.]
MSSMRRGVRTEEMQEQERSKSGLLLRGRLAKELGQHDEAAKLFGEAAGCWFQTLPKHCESGGIAFGRSKRSHYLVLSHLIGVEQT